MSGCKEKRKNVFRNTMGPRYNTPLHLSRGRKSVLVKYPWHATTLPFGLEEKKKIEEEKKNHSVKPYCAG